MANERLSHTGEATKAYDRSLQLNPNLAESEFHLGLLSKLQNDTSAATRHFERALQIDPRKARAFVEAGKLYLQSGQLPHSLELLQRAESIRDDRESRLLRDLTVLLRAAAAGGPMVLR